MVTEIRFGLEEHDSEIEQYVEALEKERAWIYARMSKIEPDVIRQSTPDNADIVIEWGKLETRLHFINDRLEQPDEETLWPTDELSAALVEEDLVKARERLDSAIEKLRYWQEVADLNDSWRSVAKERNRWAKIAWERQEEVFGLENLLIDNPASGWLPF